MSEEWNIYIRDVNGDRQSVHLDLCASQNGPDAQRPRCLAIHVPMKSPRPDGLSSSEEQDALWQLEDSLVDRLRAVNAARYVGRTTGAGRQTFYFYVASIEGLESAVDAALAGSGYEAAIDVATDAGWRHYFDGLWPDAVAFREMLDRRVLMALRESGDDLSQPRGIHHWIYFDQAANRDRFAAAASAAGFTYVPTKDGDAGDPRRFGAQLHRVDPVSPPGIHDVVAILCNLAAQYQGDYDGWETQVVKPGETPAEDAPEASG